MKLLAGMMMALLVAPIAHGSSLNELCQITDSTSLRKVGIPDSPNYFFRTFPEKMKVSYNGDGTNYILDLIDGSRFIVPGPYDPVPLWNERTVTTPSDGMKFYSIADHAEGNRSEPLLDDQELRGVYQSIGTVTSAGERARYRIVTDSDGASYRDYEVEAGPGGRDRITPLGAATRVCPELDLQLPMLSKDGMRLAALDSSVDPPVTKIFDIAGGGCREIINLGVGTGKADFSFDGRQITFHVANEDESGDYFGDASPETRMNVFVLDLQTKELRQITRNKDASSYYPVFRKDGTIVYIQSEEDGFSFVHANPRNARPVDFAQYQNASCSDNPDPFQQLVAIGQSWVELCGLLEVSDRTAALLALGLEPAQCRQMIEGHWARIAEKLPSSEITRETLLAACPQNRTAPQQQVTVQASGRGAQPATTALQVFARKCAICHSNIPWDNAQILRSMPSSRPGVTFLQEMRRRMDAPEPERMPRGGTLSPQERALVDSFLNAR